MLLESQCVQVPCLALDPYILLQPLAEHPCELACKGKWKLELKGLHLPKVLGRGMDTLFKVVP